MRYTIRQCAHRAMCDTVDFFGARNPRRVAFWFIGWLAAFTGFLKLGYEEEVKASLMLLESLLTVSGAVLLPPFLIYFAAAPYGLEEERAGRLKQRLGRRVRRHVRDRKRLAESRSEVGELRSEIDELTREAESEPIVEVRAGLGGPFTVERFGATVTSLIQTEEMRAKVTRLARGGKVSASAFHLPLKWEAGSHGQRFAVRDEAMLLIGEFRAVGDTVSVVINGVSSPAREVAPDRWSATLEVEFTAWGCDRPQRVWIEPSVQVQGGRIRGSSGKVLERVPIS